MVQLRHYPSIWLEELRNTTKPSVKISHIWTNHLLITSLDTVMCRGAWLLHGVWIGWMGFIDHLYSYTTFVTTLNYSTIADLRTLQSTVSHTHTSVLSLLGSPLSISWQFLYCYKCVFTSLLHSKCSSPIVMCVHLHGNLFIESMPSNESLLWLHYSGFQASCHNIICLVTSCSLVDMYQHFRGTCRLRL
jgi:hypothetical protein